MRKLLIGATLPAGARVVSVRLDGRRVRHYEARLTNRGLEVTVRARPGEVHTLTIRTG